jgi:hypothetical protein
MSCALCSYLFPFLYFSTVTRQINDKERVAAALENPTLRGIVTTLCQGVRGRG